MEARAEDAIEVEDSAETEEALEVGGMIGGVRFLNRAEGRTFFDEQARKLLGISGEEFLRRWDAGEYDEIADDPDHPNIMSLHMMEGFGR